jgi:hypothetical protein
MADFISISYWGLTMAFLNEQDRDKLLDDLKDMNFNRAKGKLQRMDSKGRLAYYRNVQMVGESHTKYILEGLGTIVTLVEVNHTQNTEARNNQEYEFVNIIVEPTASNRT